MTQITRRRINNNRPSHFRFTSDKLIALVSFLSLVLFGCITLISYLLLPDEVNISLDTGGTADLFFTQWQHIQDRDHDGILKRIHSQRHNHARKKVTKQRKDRKVVAPPQELEYVEPPDVNPEDLVDDDEEDDGLSKYYKIREKYNTLFPSDTAEDTQRLLDYVKSIRKPKHELLGELKPDLTYDINNCPDEPPEGYPIEWPILDLLDNWKPNNISSSIRPGIYQALCRFDWKTELQKAEKYRNAEVPFLLRDDPKVLEVVERWNHPDYLSEILGKDTKYHTEYSDTNSLMFYRVRNKKGVPEDWRPPMSAVKMTYDQWAIKASQSEENMGPDRPHYYFRVNAKGGEKNLMFKELPFFLPQKNFYIVDPKDTRGINCRFGMMGNTAAAHFDGSRNFVMLFGGERRYILSHPRSCPNMALYPRNHPSGRHSAHDWSNPDLDTYPEFAQATANEVVLQAGDVLYLPTQWFHYIVSLDLNWQCNARSGITDDYFQLIKKCGF